jgi:hypothetical protein
VRRALRQGLTPAGLAWRAAQFASAALALSVLVYQKPQSFYTNFVIFPSVVLYLSGLLCVAVALVLAVVALFKGETAGALRSAAMAVAAAAAATLIILWRAG